MTGLCLQYCLLQWGLSGGKASSFTVLWSPRRAAGPSHQHDPAAFPSSQTLPEDFPWQTEVLLSGTSFSGWSRSHHGGSRSSSLLELQAELSSATRPRAAPGSRQGTAPSLPHSPSLLCQAQPGGLGFNEVLFHMASSIAGKERTGGGLLKQVISYQQDKGSLVVLNLSKKQSRAAGRFLSVPLGACAAPLFCMWCTCGSAKSCGFLLLSLLETGCFPALCLGERRGGQGGDVRGGGR